MTDASRKPDEDDGPPRQALLEMAQGFFRGKALCAAVRLGIADALADRSMDVAELAQAIAADRRALYRLMRALAVMGVVDENAPGRFALTRLGQPLRRDAPDSVWASMVFWPDLLADAWTYLPECVRAGDRSGADAARERQATRSRWSVEPDATAIFHAVFAEPDADDFAPIVRAWDFAGRRVVADLGGGGGGLLAALLTALPAARGILFDRQAALDGAAKRFAASGLTPRCELVVGDLLEAAPAGADVYLMKSVLHGYDDEPARQILENVRRVLTADSRLLLVEVVLPDRVDRSDPGAEKRIMSDVNMLLVTGGGERSEREWRALLHSAGLELRTILPVAGRHFSILETARPEQPAA